jgi:hypothetical protein
VVYKEILRSAFPIVHSKSSSATGQEALYSDMQTLEESQICLAFRAYGYKMLITFGLLTEGSEVAQTRVVDRGGLDFILGTFYSYENYQELSL